MDGTFDKEQMFHKQYAEYEHFIADELFDYIYMEKPELIEDDTVLYFRVHFRNSYYIDENKEYGLTTVIDTYRFLFDDFLSNNPNYFSDENIKIQVVFGYDQPYGAFDEYVKLLNYIPYGSTDTYDSLNVLIFSGIPQMEQFVNPESIVYLRINDMYDGRSNGELTEYFTENFANFTSLETVSVNSERLARIVSLGTVRNGMVVQINWPGL